MKKFILMALLISVAGESFAQKSKIESRVFNVPSYLIAKRFTINLENGNTVQLALSDLNGLAYFKNTDSIIRLLIKDLKLFRDSLSNELSSKRIDYIMDSSQLRKIRIQKNAPRSENFIVTPNDVASLKLEQDTINIILIVKETPASRRKWSFPNYYRMSFYLNDVNDISSCLDGELSDKINSLIKNMDQHWARNKFGSFQLQGDPTITAPGPKGNPGGGRELSYRLSIDAQNYKNYFVPSASFGLVLISHKNLLVKELYLGVENHFLFAKNTLGKLTTYQNTFLTTSFSIRPDLIFNGHLLTPSFSLGYLVSRKGDFYEKNTFKLGFGSYSFARRTTSIEPILYFNNFFKGVTPSLRLVQNF